MKVARTPSSLAPVWRACVIVLATLAACGGGGSIADVGPDAASLAPGSEDAGVADASTGDAITAAEASTSCAPLPAPADSPPAAPLALYPPARFSALTTLGAKPKTACVDTSALASHATLDALVPSALAEAELVPAALGCACDWTLRFVAKAPSLTGNAASAWTNAGTNAERFVVVNALTDGRAASTLYAAAEAPALWAVRAALASMQSARVASGTILDWPAVAHRGVVEGIYGPSNANADCALANAYWLPYRVQDRDELVRLMSRLRMNVFMYGPKCDSYAGPGGWRDPYSIAAGQVVATAAHEAAANLVDFVWAVRPLSFYSSGTYAAELATLTAKLDQVRTLGVRRFALFWDDSYDYAGDSAAQIRLINDVDTYVKQHDPKDHLTVVGQPYCGPVDSFCNGPNATTDAFGAGLHPDIELFWTGVGVEPTTMTAAQLQGINASYRRKVTIWDNWPCAGASYCGAPGFHGRAGDLGSAIQGYYANPVLNEYNGPALPVAKFFEVLGPIADFTWNPPAYAASASSEDTSYARWKTLLGALGPKVGACKPCGNYGAYWTCNTIDHNVLEFCDPDTHCLTDVPCAHGCQTQPNPNPDICHF